MFGDYMRFLRYYKCLENEKLKEKVVAFAGIGI